LVKHDLRRYISNSLFSTPYGSDLFKNESELITNLNGCGGISTGVLRDISNALWKCGATARGKYQHSKTQVDYIIQIIVISSDNICRVIVNAINSEEPARFVSAENGVTQSNQDCRQAVPFVEGDVIQFSVMIHAQQDQHNLTGVPEIVGRTYNVSLNINTNPYSLNQVPTE
jgi:hypothetical protein